MALLFWLVARTKPELWSPSGNPYFQRLKQHLNKLCRICRHAKPQCAPDFFRLLWHHHIAFDLQKHSKHLWEFCWHLLSIQGLFWCMCAFCTSEGGWHFRMAAWSQTSRCIFGGFVGGRHLPFTQVTAPILFYFAVYTCVAQSSRQQKAKNIGCQMRVLLVCISFCFECSLHKTWFYTFLVCVE